VIGFDQALGEILAHARVGGAERVSLEDALGRVLASPLEATLDSPRFDNSAVDGYALRAEDLRSRDRLRIAQSGRAGEPSSEIAAGETARVFTGAPLPPRADAVAMQEDVRCEGEDAVFTGRLEEEDNVRRRGEEFRAGDLLLCEGTLLTPPAVALAASQGRTELDVWKRPRVGILATGSELVKPGSTLGEAQIYESNSFGLLAACRALGLEPAATVSVADDPEATRAALAGLLKSCDLVFTSGGVSVGDYDLVRAGASDLEVEEIFWRVAIKPGKPVFFGRAKTGALLLGLPGNPVSTMVTFLLFGRPLVLACMGARRPVAEFWMELAAPLRKKAGRTEFVRARLEGGRALPLQAQGSHMLGGLAQADGLIVFPNERYELEAGERVRVTPMQWTW
jgi:molybdopterin molybdotransferase